MTNPRERDRISVAKRLGRQAEVREPPDRRIGRTIAIRAIEASKIVALPDRGSPEVWHTRRIRSWSTSTSIQSMTRQSTKEGSACRVPTSTASRPGPICRGSTRAHRTSACGSGHGRTTEHTASLWSSAGRMPPTMLSRGVRCSSARHRAWLTMQERLLFPTRPG